MEPKHTTTLVIRDDRARSTSEAERRLSHLIRYSLGVLGFSVVSVTSGAAPHPPSPKNEP